MSELLLVRHGQARLSTEDYDRLSDLGIGQAALGAAEIKAAELNWRIHNGSVTRFTFSGERISPDRFNDVARLNAAALTYR